ncbi:hypothetical protein DYB32_009900 [Aphanomyces invadans]|uniref:GAG-pre-integrase domain-containing protein n=1 Tax=Aphanomyces invadans TaxID=157072 RepID=A0A418AH68_9STRA|nr:hypothetical protein DYB32_009900 [Aphanomyces invadans]
MSPTNPRSLLILTDTNWNLWRTAFRGRLLAKGIMHVMNIHSTLLTDAERRAKSTVPGTDRRSRTSMSDRSPADEKDIEVWQEDNQKALGLLIEMIDPSQYHIIEDATTCHDAYHLLERRHEPSTKVDRIALMSDYHAINWNPKQETLQAFLERFEILLRKLQGADCAEPEHMSVVKLLALMPVTNANKSGDLSLKTSCGTQVVLKDVLVVDGMPMTLMSVPALLRSNKDCEVTFKDSSCIVKVNGKTIATASTDSTGKVYILNAHQMTPEMANAAVDQSTLWHQRIGHLPVAALKKCADAGLGLPRNLTTSEAKCSPCTMSKIHKISAPKVSNHKYKPGECWVSDTKGPMRTENASTKSEKRCPQPASKKYGKS